MISDEIGERFVLWSFVTFSEVDPGLANECGREKGERRVIGATHATAEIANPVERVGGIEGTLPNL